MLSKVISGGQTGADQAALRAAKACGIPTGGTAAARWFTEDGPATWLASYGLVECDRSGYPARTRANVFAADGLVWFGNPYSPGGKLTFTLATEANIDTFAVVNTATPGEVADWIFGHLVEGSERPPVLMVAGNRESKSPGIGHQVETFLTDVFRRLYATV